MNVNGTSTKAIKGFYELHDIVLVAIDLEFKYENHNLIPRCHLTSMHNLFVMLMKYAISHIFIQIVGKSRIFLFGLGSHYILSLPAKETSVID